MYATLGLGLHHPYTPPGRDAMVAHATAVRHPGHRLRLGLIGRPLREPLCVLTAAAVRRGRTGWLSGRYDLYFFTFTYYYSTSRVPVPRACTPSFCTPFLNHPDPEPKAKHDARTACEPPSRPATHNGQRRRRRQVARGWSWRASAARWTGVRSSVL